MSTLNVSNISDGTTSVGTSYVVNGSAKAWVSASQEGTTSVLDSLNVSSLTDLTTGQTTVSLSSNMATANYGVTYGCKGAASVRTYITGGNNSFADQTSSFHRLIVYQDATSTYEDIPYANSAVFGDLA